MTTINGGCLCGQVRYRAESEPAYTAICHCRDCQRQSGSAFGLLIGVRRPALTLDGPVRYFESPGDSGRAVRRGFCAQCGSSVVLELEALPDMAVVMGGTLDDPSWLAPTVEVFCDSAQGWLHLAGERRRFARMPPRG